MGDGNKDTFSLAPKTREAVDPNNPTGDQNKGATNSGSFSLAPKQKTLSNGEYSLNSTTKDIRGVEASDPNFNYKLSKTQGAGETIYNTLAGGTKLAVAGVLDGINQWNLKDAADMMTGVEKDYGSVLHDLSNSIRKNAEENNPIYEKNPGSFSPSDPAFWATQFQQLGYSVGLIGEAAAEQIGLAYATGGTGNEVALASKLNLFKKLGLSLSTKALARDFAFGSFKGLQEGYLNGIGTFEEERESLIAKGVDKDEATRLAAHAASEAYRREAVPTMLLGGLQYGMMTYNPVTKSSTGFLERAIKNKVAAKAATYGAEMLSEGFEEVYQNIASLEGKYVADKMAGLPVHDKLGDRMAGYLTSDDNWNQFVGGALGGVVFGGVGSIKNKLLHSQAERDQEAQYQGFKNSMQAVTFNHLNEAGKLRNEGKEEEAQMMLKRGSNLTALNGYHLDHLNNELGHESAYEGHVAFLNNTIDAINSKDATQLAKLKIDPNDEAHMKHVKDSFTSMLADATQIKTIYDGLKDNYDGSEVAPLTYRHFMRSSLEKMATGVEARAVQAQAGLQLSSSLSPQAREISDINHQTNAIVAEMQRLNGIKETLTHPTEKANVDKLLRGLQEKADVFEARIAEITEDEAYTPELQEKDGALLDSSPVNVAYIKALAEKHQLASEIERLNQEINLFDDPKYKSDINRQNIKNAQTLTQLKKAQAKATKDAIRGAKKDAKNKKKNKYNPATIEENAKLPSEVTETIKEKEQQILASQEKAKNPKTSPLGVVLTPDDEEGGGAIGYDPTDRDDTAPTPNSRKLLGDAIGTLVLPKAPEAPVTPSTGATVIESEGIFDLPESVREFTDEEKAKVKSTMIDYMQSLGEELGHTPTFEEFIRDYIKNNGKQVVDGAFNGLVSAWKVAGLGDADFKGVYAKFFGDRKHLALSLNEVIAQATVAEEVKVVEEEKKAEEVVAKKELGPSGFDADNKPIYYHSGFTTSEEAPKMAYVSRLANRQITQNADGSYQVGYEYAEEGLHQGDYVDSLSLLDPDRFQPGTAITIERPSNYMDIPVAIYDAIGNRAGAVPFSKYAADLRERGLGEDSQEYIDKLPLVIKDDRGVAVSFVQDAQWYNGATFRQSNGDVNAAIKNNREVRAKVLSGDNKATVTHKSMGTFNGLMLKNADGTNRHIPISEAAPEAQIVVGSAVGTTSVQLSTGKGDQLSLNVINQNDTDGTSLVKDGEAYDVRRYGTDENGKPTYMMFPVNTPLLGSESQTSFLKAVEVYLHQLNPNLPIPKRQELDRIAEEIKAKSGIDIKDRAGIEHYLTQFAIPFTPKAKLNLQSVTGNAEEKAAIKAENAQKTNRLRADAAKSLKGGKFFFFFESGALVLGHTQRPISGNTPIFVLAPAVIKGGNPAVLSMVDSLMNILKTQTLPGFSQSVNLRVMKADKPVVHIKEDGSTNLVSPNYQDYIKTQLKTNIKSEQIDTPTGKKWITAIQPVITYQMNSNLNAEVNPTMEKVVKEVVEANTVPTPTPTSTSNTTNEQGPIDGEFDITKLSPEQLDAYIKSISENQSWLNTDMEGYDALPLSDEQVGELSAAIKRIPGLTASEQYYFVDFMYNQIQTLVDFESKEAISKEAISKSIRQVYDKLIPTLRKQKLTEKENLEKALAMGIDRPGLKEVVSQLERVINKIDALDAAYPTMEAEAYNKVSKYTGISEEEIDDEAKYADGEPKADGTSEEDTNERNSDFSTDVLTEDGKSTSSYRLKRFFAGIENQKLEANGVAKTVTNFLNIPTYVGFDSVYNTVAAILAGVDADYNTQIAKLKDVQEAYPWLNNLIKKLDGASQQIKNEFVSTMSKHNLNMEFVMYSFDKKSSKYTLKVYNTNANAITQLIQGNWVQNFKKSGSGLVHVVGGKYVINKTIAQGLIDEYNSWLDRTPSFSNSFVLTELKGALELAEQQGAGAKIETKGISNPAITGPLDKALSEGGGKIKIERGNKVFFVSKGEGARYNITVGAKASVTQEAAGKWLEAFGINLSPQTLKDLFTGGMYHNGKRLSFTDVLMNEGGKDTNQSDSLFGLLKSSLEFLVRAPEDTDVEEDDVNPLSEGVIRSLAAMESKYNVHTVANSFRDGSKSIYGFTANKYITDRTKDLKAGGKVVTELLSTSFGSESMWLRMLQDDPLFREKFSISHLGLTAFKQMGKKNYTDNNINNLADADHELTKVGMFEDMKQGTMEKTFLGLPLRIARMFSPTMSDKSTMTVLKTAVFNLTSEHFSEDGVIDQKVVEMLYKQTVLPELKRIINYQATVRSTGIKGYDKGASLFLLMPIFNDLKLNDEGLTLRGAITQDSDFTLEAIESNPEYMKRIHTQLKEVVNHLIAEKQEVWAKNGYYDAEGNLMFLDSNYLYTRRGKNDNHTKYIAAADFVINELVSNVNSFMALSGDPAVYYKKEKTTANDDFVGISRDTFTNVGKRLANQIAPGVNLADSVDNNYLQIFLNDRSSVANNIGYLEKILGKEGAKDYRDIEGTDAQEYTTWKEHLYILEKLGRTPDVSVDITPEEIRESREIFASERSLNNLSEKQRKLINKVMQPIKPVYTGQHFSARNDMMRVVYIKSSSFPLIPQLTQGLEIDKIRKAMEHMESTTGKTVRASYQTANKVGANEKAVDLFNEDGSINADNLTLDKLTDSSVLLSRKNFRIQQDVPYKSAKRLEDTITLGTQTMKLLFGDGILATNGFTYNGKPDMTGIELHKEYNNLFGELITHKRDELYSELGIDPSTGKPVDAKETAKKLQAILEKEASGRGYSKQDLEALELNEDGKFVIPLWASANSDKYESLLNAIVNNRIVKMKIPGNSFVVGSEEGFRKSEDINDVKGHIVFTKNWTGELKAAYAEDGTLHKAQVLAPSKFRDKEGNLIDLMQRKDGEYVYITSDTDGTVRLKEGMIASELLELTAFRIPTSGHVSMSQIEIVGFIPTENGDLMITPRNFTKQMGQDFDIDKLNTYQLSHQIGEHTGKIEVLKGDISKAKGKHKEKLLQNAIVSIHRSVLSNPSNDVQRKINNTLSIQFAKEQASLIDGIISKDGHNKYFTPLSGEYQKAKMGLGAAGKVGTGSYSLDVVGHSLFQQIALSQPDNPLKLTELIDGDIVVKTFRFGQVTSDGKLGRIRTLGVNGRDGERTISQVMMERQNIAVDNEKEQVMGRVNLNGLTLDVDKVFNMLGFDKGEDGNSISMLFLSQPILREYVNMMKNAKANIAEFSADREQRIINNLKLQFGVPIEEIAWNDDLLSNESLMSQLKAEKPDGHIQGMILDRFLEMREYGEAIRNIQTTINVDAKGLGKSYFDLLAKRDSLSSLGNSPLVSNATKLIGDYKKGREMSPSQQEEAIKDGYTLVGEYYIKPNSLSGHFAVTAVSTAINLWSEHFPYDDGLMAAQFNEIVKAMAKDSSTDRKKIELKQEILREMKKYLFTKVSLGIYDVLPQIERARLFMDKEGENTSLASYVHELKNSKQPNLRALTTSNRLLSRLVPEVNKLGKASLLKFNNATAEDFDEEYMHMALINLIEANAVLPAYNGDNTYTTRKLAQDLIKYAYLEGGVQQAIQFVKHVPVHYLKLVGFARVLGKMTFKEGSPDPFGLTFSNDEKDAYKVSKFTMQYAQHNPQRMPKLDETAIADGVALNPTYVEGKAASLENLQTFEISTDKPSPFLSIYNSGIKGKDVNKFQLYWFNGESYNRVPVLGQFGMSEYQIKTNFHQSLVNQPVDTTNLTVKDYVPTKAAPIENQPPALPYSLETGDISAIMQAVSKDDSIGGLSKIAELLLPYVDKTTTISVGDESASAGYRVRGRYFSDRNHIGIDIKSALDHDNAAKTILHEQIHSVTVNYLAQYTDASGNITPNAPPALQRLNSLFLQAQKAVGADKIAAVQKKLDDKRNGIPTDNFSAEEVSLVYGVINLKEFFTVSMTDPIFIKFLDTLPYNEHISMWDKFKNIIQDILKTLIPGLRENSVATQTLSTILDVLNEKEEAKTKQNSGKFVLGTPLEVDRDEMGNSIDSPQAWARYSPNGYEVSSKGDKRFSALFARLKDGRTIEEAYQLDVKGYRSQGNDWKLGKGKAPIRPITTEQQWEEYKSLWKIYLQENPVIFADLREKASGKVLTDMFASTPISQARALAELINDYNQWTKNNSLVQEDGEYAPKGLPTIKDNNNNNC